MTAVGINQWPTASNGVERTERQTWRVGELRESRPMTVGLERQPVLVMDKSSTHLVEQTI